MSLESARAFREHVSTNTELQNFLRNNPDADMLALGKEHGFDFTWEDGKLLQSQRDNYELSDFELEWVSAGTVCEVKMGGP